MLVGAVIWLLCWPIVRGEGCSRSIWGVGYLLVQEVVPNTSCAGVAEFWVLVLEACDGASAGDGVANTVNTGGVVVSNGGGGAEFSVTSSGPVNTTVLCTDFFPTCAASGGLLLFW